MISILQFSKAADQQKFMKDFAALPRQLNQSQTNLPDEYWTLLFTKMDNLTKDLFLVQVNDEFVARASVNIFRPNPQKGFFGCLSYKIDHALKDEILKNLYDAMEGWLLKQGVNEIIGPIDFSTWFGYRFKLAKTQHNFSWEPSLPTEYYTDAIQMGYEHDVKFLSALYNNYDTLHSHTKSHYEKAIEAGYNFQKVQTNSDEEIRNVLKLNLTSFKKSYLYDNVTQEQFNSLFINFIKKENAQYVYLMKKDDKDLGFIYAFEEQNFLIIKTLLIMPEARQSNLGNALVHHCFSEAKKNNLEKFVAAMIREDNTSLEFLKHLPDKLGTHYYQLVKKTFNTH